jgi:hypothetical protein
VVGTVVAAGVVVGAVVGADVEAAGVVVTADEEEEGWSSPLHDTASRARPAKNRA